MSSPCSVTLEHGCDHGAAQCQGIYLVLAGLNELGETLDAAGFFRAGSHRQDAKLVLAWNALTWAFAETGHGQIHSADGTLTPAEFASRVDLPAAFCRDTKSDK